MNLPTTTFRNRYSVSLQLAWFGQKCKWMIFWGDKRSWVGKNFWLFVLTICNGWQWGLWEWGAGSVRGEDDFSHILIMSNVRYFVYSPHRKNSNYNCRNFFIFAFSTMREEKFLFNIVNYSTGLTLWNAFVTNAAISCWATDRSDTSRYHHWALPSWCYDMQSKFIWQSHANSSFRLSWIPMLLWRRKCNACCKHIYLLLHSAAAWWLDVGYTDEAMVLFTFEILIFSAGRKTTA